MASEAETGHGPEHRDKGEQENRWPGACLGLKNDLLFVLNLRI
jgi:hypothetical protein